MEFLGQTCKINLSLMEITILRNFGLHVDYSSSILEDQLSSIARKIYKRYRNIAYTILDTNKDINSFLLSTVSIFDTVFPSIVYGSCEEWGIALYKIHMHQINISFEHDVKKLTDPVVSFENMYSCAICKLYLNFQNIMDDIQMEPNVHTPFYDKCVYALGSYHTVYETYLSIYIAPFNMLLELTANNTSVSFELDDIKSEELKYDIPDIILKNNLEEEWIYDMKKIPFPSCMNVKISETGLESDINTKLLDESISTAYKERLKETKEIIIRKSL